MKTALFVLNKVEEHYMAMMAMMLTEHRGFIHRFVTLSPSLHDLLRQKGLPCHLVDKEFEEGMYERFDGMDRLSAGPMLDGMKLPASELPVSHAIFWDRLSQWFNFRKSDHALDLAEALAFDVLVAPLDIDDGFAQSMMREAKRRGVPTVGIKSCFLRTKENMDAFWCFDRVLVDSQADMRFLVAQGKVQPGNVIVVSDAAREEQVRTLAANASALGGEARRRLGIPMGQRVHTVLFGVRHAWECRRLLRSLIEARKGGLPAVKNVALVVQLEGPQEAVDFPFLFREEAAALNPILSPHTLSAYHVGMASDAVVYFRMHPILEDLDKAGRRTVLFDPHKFNRSHRMGLEATGIRLQTGATFDWSALESQ